MKGTILDFSFQTNSGAIAGDDGNRYSFTGAQWQAPDFPETGMRVDFDADGATAVSIYIDTAPAPAPVATPASVPTRGGAPDQGATPGTPPVMEMVSVAAATASVWFAVAREHAVKYSAVAWTFLKRVPRMYLIAGGAGIGVVVVAVIALIALSATGIIGGGNPQPVSVLDLTPQEVTTVVRLDVQKILAEEDLAEDMEINDFVDLDEVGILAEEVSEIVTADGGSGGSLTILRGDFNLDDVKEEWEDDGAEEDAYRGYEVWTLSDGTIAAPLKGYLVMSDSEDPVEDVLKNLYNGAGSLEQADRDNAMKRLLDRLGRGYVVYAAGARSCRVDGCVAYGYVLAEYDQEEEEAKSEIVLLFRNEQAAQRAADDYDEVADFLEYEAGIDIEDTESDGDFVVGIAWQELD